MNHLDIAPPGGAHRAEDAPVNATAEALTVGGHKVYAAYFEGGMGYRIDKGNGIATGNEPETLYAVFGGKVSCRGSGRLYSVPFARVFVRLIQLCGFGSTSTEGAASIT